MNNLIKAKDSIDNLFGDFFHMGRKNTMKTDIMENEKEYSFFIEVPGLKKENIKVNYEDGYLVIEAEHSYSNDCNGECYIHKERVSENISRSFHIGKDVDEEAIKAELKDGILHLNVPKKEEEKTKKYINIM